MKKVYNKFTTSDIPLDASLEVPPATASKLKSTTKKPTINAIGSKAKAQVNSRGVGKKPTQTLVKKGSVRKKLSKYSSDLQDLEKLNEENIKTHSFRSKRNQVIVVLLSILLAIAITFIVVYMMISKVENNCFIYINGNAEAVCLVNNQEISEFRSPANIQGECILELNVDLKIKTAGNYKVKFSVSCYNGESLLKNVVVYEPNTTESGFTYKTDGYYHTKSELAGDTTINLCKGVALNEIGVGLYDDEFKLEIHIFIEKVQ